MRRSTRRRTRRTQGGFTLLELLVTLAVSVFGLMGILALHNSLTQGANVTGQSQEAIAVGGQVIESLRSVRPVALAEKVTGTATSPPFSNTTYATVLGRNGVSYSVGVGVTTVAATLWRVRVEVSWTDDVTGIARTLPLELLRTSREAL